MSTTQSYTSTVLKAGIDWTEWTDSDNLLHFIPLTWDGILTGKELAASEGANFFAPSEEANSFLQEYNPRLSKQIIANGM